MAPSWHTGGTVGLTITSASATRCRDRCSRSCCWPPRAAAAVATRAATAATADPATTEGFVGPNDTGTPVPGGITDLRPRSRHERRMVPQQGAARDRRYPGRPRDLRHADHARCATARSTRTSRESVTGTNNNQTWTIKLRPNIKFHDGTPLNAAIVKDNLDAYQQAATRSSRSCSPTSSRPRRGRQLTVEVTTKRAVGRVPVVPLEQRAASASWPRRRSSPPDCNTKLIGTGPFEKVSWKFGDKFVAEKQPELLGEGQGRPAAAVPRPDHVRPAGRRCEAARGRSKPATSR